MALNKRKTRMYEPWGYREENEYQGSATILENDLNSLFASAEYDKKDGCIHFKNKDGEEVGKLDTSDFSSGGGKEVDTITYNSETQTVVIKYKDGSTINVPVKIDKNEFKDGLSVTTTTSSGVKTNVIKVKKDPTSEPWLSVSTNGVKVSGIQAQVDRLDGKIDDEASRAQAKEQELDNKISELDVSNLFGYSEYDSDTTRINFYHSSSDTTPLSFIDASPFVKDGMVDSVEIKTITSGGSEVTVLEIVFNTDAGKETIDIPIDDLFNADEYYKKSEIDEKFSEEEAARISADTTLAEAIDEERAERISSFTEIEQSFTTRLNELREALNAENSARTEADAALEDKIDEEIGRATSAETALEEKISALREMFNNEISRLDTVTQDLSDADIASGNVAQDATLTLTRNNGDVITFSQAERVDFTAGEF